MLMHVLIRRRDQLAMKRQPRPFTVGLIQMRCSTDPDDNLQRACALLREAAGQRRPGRLPARAVSHPVLLPDRGRRAVRPGRADPRPDHRGAVRRWHVRPGWSWSARSSSAATPGIYHNTAVVIDADGTLRGRYRKMHIPDDPLYYEKYYFTPGDLGFQAFETSVARVGTLGLLGPVVSRGRPADGPARGRDPVLSHGDRLAPGREGRVRRGPSRAPGRPSSARTRSPTESTSRPSTGSATKGPPTAAWNSGAARFWPIRSAGSSPGPDDDSRGGSDRHLRPESSRKKPAATGRSSATGASTPTRRSPSGSSTSISRKPISTTTAP